MTPTRAGLLGILGGTTVGLLIWILGEVLG